MVDISVPSSVYIVTFGRSHSIAAVVNDASYLKMTPHCLFIMATTLPFTLYLSHFWEIDGTIEPHSTLTYYVCVDKVV